MGLEGEFVRGGGQEKSCQSYRSYGKGGIAFTCDIREVQWRADGAWYKALMALFGGGGGAKDEPLIPQGEGGDDTLDDSAGNTRTVVREERYGRRTAANEDERFPAASKE